MVILESFGPSMLAYFRKSIEKQILEKKKSADEAEKAELNFVGFLLKILPLVSHLHKALFYYSSGTYHISKRITGIHYVSWVKFVELIVAFDAP